jgi:heme/copper-type cytochrome/quinol oxidase subunit 2
MKCAILLAVGSFVAGAGLVTVALALRPNREPNSAGLPPPRSPERVSDPVAPGVQEDTTYADLPPGSPFNRVTVELTGHQDRWHVNYRGPGGTVWPAPDEVGPGGTTRLRLPADSDVRLVLTSRDLVYMLSLPRISKSQVAVPSREFPLEFRSQAPGVFALIGSHVCGPLKPTLHLTVFVEPKPQFEAWLTTQARDGARRADR